MAAQYSLVSSAILSASICSCTFGVGDAESLGSVGSLLVSTCDGSWNGVPVEKVPANFGVTQPFVSSLQRPTGLLNGGCSGTLVSDNLFLTASHCIPGGTVAPGSIVEFDFQEGPTGLRTITAVKVLSVVEYQRAVPPAQAPANILQDYALLKLEGTPGLKFGRATLATADVKSGDRVTLIGHHGARPKEVTTGFARDMSGLYLNHDADIEDGISGGPVWNGAGKLAGVQFRAGCDTGGFNGALKISTLLALSPTLQRLSVPPVVLPAKVQAENYVNYSDVDTTNHGGQGSTSCAKGDGVDLASTSDGGAGCVVGWTSAGEWLEYDVTSPGGNFDPILRASAAMGAVGRLINVTFNGVGVGSVGVQGTGFATYNDYALRQVYLAPGTYRTRVTFETGGVNLNYVNFRQSYASLPTKLEAESYARFQDGDATNLGAASSPACNRNDAVDLQTTTDVGGGCNVGWTRAGEWLEYDVRSPGGTFSATLRLASGNASNGRRVVMQLDGVALGPVVQATAKGWQVFANHVVPGLLIPAGNHRLRVLFETGGVNFNSLSLQ